MHCYILQIKCIQKYCRFNIVQSLTFQKRVIKKIKIFNENMHKLGTHLINDHSTMTLKKKSNDYF